MVWKILHRSSIMVDWFISKYDSLWNPISPRSSALWKELKLSASKFRNEISISIGNNSSLSLFFDPWCSGQSIFELFGSECFNLLMYHPHCSVSSILSDGAWNLSNSFLSRHPSTSQKILSIPLNQDCDVILWEKSKIRTNKQIILSLFALDATVCWLEGIWFKGLALNQALFCWMAYVRVLKTSDFFSSEGLSSTINCCLCNNAPESHTHLFFECLIFMWLIRNALPKGNYFLLQASLQQVLNDTTEISHKAVKRLRYLIIALCVYVIWRERNARLHYSGACSPQSLLAKVESLVAHKLRRWNIKTTWPEHVIIMLETRKNLI